MKIEIKDKLKQYSFELAVVMFFLIVFGIKTGLMLIGFMICMLLFYLFFFTKIGRKISVGLIILYIILTVCAFLFGLKVYFGPHSEY